jgi:D-arabinose 5-phosphate isomerase GutQ
MSIDHAWYDRTLLTEAKAIENLTKKLDYRALDKIVERLLKAKRSNARVFVAGCGTSGAAAKRIAHTLSCIEIPGIFLSPADAPHGAMGMIQPGDVVVLISKGGGTPEILNYVPCCKDKGATIVGVTHNPDSALASECDLPLILDTGEEPCPWKMMPCASTLGVIAAFDAIILATMRLNGFTKEQFLRIHPGGATGDALRGGSSIRG